MTSSPAPIILIVLLTVVTSGTGKKVDIALSPAAIHTSGSAAIKSSQLVAALHQQVDRMKRSSEFKESDRFVPQAEELPAEDTSNWKDEGDELGGQFPVKRGQWAKNNVQMWGKRSLQSSGFVPLAEELSAEDSPNWKDDVDEFGVQFPIKRGRWAKNNVQMWGKRSFQSSGQRPFASISPWASSEGDVANVGLRHRSPSPRSYGGASVDGTWSKRKKTWEKNNFKMWGKRSVGNPDEEPVTVDRYLPLIARRVMEERRLSRPGYSDGYSGSVIDELELPSSSLSSNVDGGRNSPLPYAVEDLRELVQRPKKKVGWSSNNVHMWG